MKLVIIAALIAACRAAKLDRTYLPPASSDSAGGFPVVFDHSVNLLLPGLQAPFQRTSDNIPSQGTRVPVGSYENDHQGVVVDAAAPGTRASNQPTGLGGSRENYGSTDSKVGEAAFRGTKNQNAPTNEIKTPHDQTQPQGPGFQTAGQTVSGNDFKLVQDTISPIKFVTDKNSSSFFYGFETENGIKVAAGGKAGETTGMSTEGGFSFVGDDGKVYSLTYTADKGGFRPSGSHLPTPPPVPAEIVESLQQNAKDEANGIYDDGSYDAQKYNAEEDYTQSDANGDDNDRQSNTFGVRPGVDAGRDTFINQAHRGFVRPNAQGQFGTYFSNTQNSPTPPVGTTYVTGFPGFGSIRPWDRLAFNQFGQPGLNIGTNAFFNQGQQGFVRPNTQKPFGSYDFSKHTLSTGQNIPVNHAFGFGSQFQYLPPVVNVQGSKPFQEKDTFKGNVINNFNSAPSFSEQTIQNQGTNKPTSLSQYLPPVEKVLNSKPFQEKDSSKINVIKNFNNVPSLLEQNIQNQAFGENPFTTQTKPNSNGADQGSLNVQGTSFNQESSGINTGFQNNANTPQKLEQVFQSGVQSSLTPDNNTSLTPIIINGIMPNQENVKNSQTQSASYPTDLPNTGDSKDKKGNLDFSSIFSFSPSLQPTNPPPPTKQPELSLTTPLENQQVQTLELGSSFIDSQPQNPNSLNFGNTQSFSSNNNQQTSGEYSNSLPKQPQGPDSSYIYYKPVKPFKSISTPPNSSTIYGLTPSQLNSTVKPFGSLSSNAPDGSVFSTQFQSLTGSAKYPQPPTLTPVAPTLVTTKENSTVYQNNGVTQASISPFPLITPTSPSQTTYSGEIYEYSKPVQGLPISTQKENFVFPEKITTEENPSKPPFNLQSNTEFGQRFPNPGMGSFGQESTPPRLSVPTSSSFEPKPTVQQQSEQQGAILFGQKPVNLPFGAHTTFGVKPVQQQVESQSSFSSGTKTTPSHAQTVNQQTTQPQSIIQISSTSSTGTSPTFGEQSKLPQLGDQTNLFFRPRPTQIQSGDISLGSQATPMHTISTSFNQRTTSLPVGFHSSSSFGIPSRFGAQTTFGYKPIQSQPTGQTSSSFGSQITPSPFVAQTIRPFNQQTSPLGSSSSFGTQSQVGSQTSLTIGQNPTKPQLTTQNNLIFGSKSKPPRIGELTTSIYGQKLNQQQPCGVCGSRPGIQTSTSFDQQIMSPSFSTPPHFGVQKPFRQKPTQSQLGTQSSLSQTTSTRFGTQPSTSFGQYTTPSRISIQSNLPGQQSTASSFGVETGTLFGQKTTLPVFNVQTGSSFGQQTTSSPFGIQTFGQKISPTKLDDSSSKQQSIQQIGYKQQQNENFSGSKQQSQRQELYEKFETQTDSTPSTMSISQKEIIGSGEIYQYNKPTTNFVNNIEKKPSRFSQQPEFNGPLGPQGANINKEDETSINQQSVDHTDDQQSNTQSVEETFSTLTQNQGSSQSNVQHQVTLFPRFPEQQQQEQQKVTSLPFVDNTPSQFVAPTSPSGQSTDSTKFTNPQFSLTSTTTTTELHPQNSQSTFNLQNKDPQINTQSSEIYQYNKPTSSSAVPSQLANNQFGQNTEQSRFPVQSDEIKLDISKPVTSQLSQNNEKINTNQVPAQNSDQQSELTQDNLPSSKPSNSHPSFYSACCRNSKPNNSAGSFSGKVSDTQLNTNFGSNNIFNKNSNQDSGSIDFGVQRDSPTVNAKGEEFGRPRDPPRFDSTGYHY